MLSACNQQMGEQPAYRPLSPSDFFADGRSARPMVPGTVARGQLKTDLPLYEGQDDKGAPVTAFPFEMSQEVLERGRQRYNIFCSVCHGLTGNGDGRIVQRGFTPPPSFVYEVNAARVLVDDQGKLLTDQKGRTWTLQQVAQAIEAGVQPVPSLSRGYRARGEKKALIDVPVGYLYRVITRGYGAMADYSAQIPVKDRWAIVGYVRTLQYSSSPELRKKLTVEQRKGEQK
jgi:hypothetical protein